MKIRTDFVTNSSSSSFVVEINIDLKNGEQVSFSGNGATAESGIVDYFEAEAIVKVSPRQLGTAKTVEELIRMLVDGVVADTWDEEVKIFEKHHQIQSYCGRGTNDPYEFIDEIRSRIKLMDDIESITISGNEYNYVDYLQTFTYNRETSAYTCVITGEEFEKDGSSGGDLRFKDRFLAKGIQICVDEDGVETTEAFNPDIMGRHLRTEDLPITVSIEGTAYEGRNERLEHVHVGDKLILKMDLENDYYKPVAIEVFNSNNETLGYIAESWNYPLTNIARIMDEVDAYVDSITPLSAQRKNAKYAKMDVRLVTKEVNSK